MRGCKPLTVEQLQLFKMAAAELENLKVRGKSMLILRWIVGDYLSIKAPRGGQRPVFDVHRRNIGPRYCLRTN